MQSRQLALLGSIIVVCFAIAAGGGWWWLTHRAVPIRAIVNHPSQYDGRTVRIRGVVEGSITVIRYGGYKVNDGTGSIIVLTRGVAPKRGSKVTVSGQVKSVFQIGDISGVVIIEYNRRE
ncbi:MAG TPA: hypothetical protein EYP10_13300 [Armatimonadetes bacterium]|nr:hypothetical protein [Armatimonadota bacterium]